MRLGMRADSRIHPRKASFIVATTLHKSNVFVLNEMEHESEYGNFVRRPFAWQKCHHFLGEIIVFANRVRGWWFVTGDFTVQLAILLLRTPNHK